MFTGLIESLGTVISLRKGNKSSDLTIVPKKIPFETEIGASIAINGICLTVTHIDGRNLRFTAVDETLQKSSLSRISSGDLVNLERAMSGGKRFDGHIVQGHVDGVGKIINDQMVGESLIRTIEVPYELMKFMAYKGSITLDGISLTISDSRDSQISVSLIPHTLDETTLPLKKCGDSVNIECDVIARYLAQLMKYPVSREESTMSTDNNNNLLSIMEKNGF